MSEEQDKKVKKRFSADIDLDGKTDAADIKEILGVVSTEVPALIKNIFTSLYDPDIAVNYGKGIGQLYKELTDQGLPEDMVREVVMKYANSINVIGDAVKSEARKSDDK